MKIYLFLNQIKNLYKTIILYNSLLIIVSLLYICSLLSCTPSRSLVNIEDIKKIPPENKKNNSKQNKKTYSKKKNKKKSYHKRKKSSKKDFHISKKETSEVDDNEDQDDSDIEDIEDENKEDDEDDEVDSEDAKDDDSEEDDEEENKSVNYPTLGYRENKQDTIDIQLKKLRKKIFNSSVKNTSKNLYNPLGYSIKVPLEFQINNQDPVLWKLRSQSPKKYDQQIIIGFVKNPKQNIYEIIRIITDKYNINEDIFWIKISPLPKKKLESSNARKGVFTTKKYNTEKYYNYIYIQVCQSNNNNVVFIIATLSANKSFWNSESIYAKKYKILQKIVNSFTFL